ncbi:hypothetical protein K8I61_03490, partial [bacterium]|nr:hypothetical protein [bacterium]
MYACGIVFTLGDDYFVFAEDAAQVCDLMDNDWTCYQTCIDNDCPGDVNGALACMTACDAA